MLGVVVGVPALLIAVAITRFHHASPLHGMTAPWHWSADSVRSWGRRLMHGLDSSAALVDLFFRLALVVAWLCVAILIYTIVDEIVFQVRHGMPSSRGRRLGALGFLARRLATILVAVLPLAITATPTLARPAVARGATGVVGLRAADLSVPALQRWTTPVATTPVAAATTGTLGSGWSLIEVKRGDSVWAIAERVAGQRRVAAIADQIVAANLGTMMNDGHRFTTPALIEPGWLLNVPVGAGDVPIKDPVDPSAAPPIADAPERVEDAQVVLDPDPGVAGDGYVVVAGDSYWQIAADHLDRSASPSAVAAYTDELMRINAPTLGRSDRRLIRPGDVLLLGLADPAVAGKDPTEAEPPLATALPGVEQSSPAPVIDPPTAVVSTVPLVVGPPSVSAPVATAASPAAVDETISAFVDNMSSDGVPIRQGLGAAVLLAGGAILVLDSRRRRQLRSARVGARLHPPGDEAIETETVLRSLDSSDRLARVDLALRCAAPDLARQHARALAIEVADDGEIRIYTDRPTRTAADRWFIDVEAGAWRLPANVTLADLAERARRTAQPCPALIHIGDSAGGQLFVDLEGVGLLCVDAAPEVATAIVRCAAASLAVSPFAESARVFTVGLEIETHLGNLNAESHACLGDAEAAVRTTVGSIDAATSGSVTTFALRTAAHGGEAWEPSLLLSVGPDDPDELAALVSLVGGGGRGVGAMVDRPVTGSGAVLRADGGDFVLEPFGRRLTPVGLSAADVFAVDDLLDSAQQQLPVTIDAAGEVMAAVSTLPRFAERSHALVVQLLGDVAVQAVDGSPVVFDRSKSQELVVWLSQHRRRPTRSSARTALWDVAVRDATFSNVVSDARRSMAKVVVPPAGQEWIGRTMNDDLPLHDLVVSDAELLADRVAAARGLDPDAAIAVLRPGIELIQGMPFAGSAYLWPDAEGITSALVLLATSAAAELADHYLSVGDIDGVFWATGHGLKVLAGHEELIALRMKAHAYRGDLSGVRGEWDSYERAIAADTWSAAEPSPKLIDLRRALLSPSLAS